MAYQIIGLRDYVNRRTGKLQKRHAFFERGYKVLDPKSIFLTPEEVVNMVPEKDRVNLYYTAADCFDTEVRKLKEQWLLPFDIDDLKLEGTTEQIKIACQRVLTVACEAISIDPNKTAAVCSGNGLQFVVRLTFPIMSEDYFDNQREVYKLVAEKIQLALKKNHIEGLVDTSVFSAARLLRLPNTWNDKTEQGKGKKWAFVVQPNLEPQVFNMEELIGDTEIKRADTIDKEAWKQKHYTPDVKGVLNGCDFLKWCKDQPNKVDANQWYAMLGITSFLPDGDKIGHQYSEGYKTYDYDETQDKIEQAKRASGPRTCKDISTRWDGCSKCPYYNHKKVRAPIMIQGADYIATRDTGFRLVRITEDGKPVPGKVEYEDLIRFFLQNFEYIKVNKNGMYVYADTEKRWIPFSEDEARNWCRMHVEPKPSKHEMQEFVGRLQAENIRPKDWLDRADDVHINFSNGVLDRSTMELKTHDSKYGFKYVLPFPYNPHAQASLFEKFLHDVLEGDAELIKLIKEFGGYCLSGDEYWEHKALVLIGDGSNGKSVFMDVLKAVAGKANASSITMRDLANREARWDLVNKLVNCSEETSIDSLLRSDVFKTLASGGEIQVRHYYEQPFDYRNKTKLILSCNELPTNRDVTHGMFRRLIIVPFNRVFSKTERDPFLKKKLIDEASGIYNVLLRAYMEMKQRQQFTEAKAAETMLSQYRYDSDPVEQFVNECIIFDEAKVTTMGEIYRVYFEFCQKSGYRDSTKTSSIFAKHIAKVTDGKVKSYVTKEGGKTVRLVKGVSVNEVF